ncbi:MAG: exo-alpha-sialidase, partial [Gammaproteobacteria bacterium]|nr:exo-alpha-sialidase [Gammaproteobacteria bacterium]
MLNSRAALTAAFALAITAGCTTTNPDYSKTNLQDTELTAPYKTPPDEWLHSRRMAGSHVSLRQIRDTNSHIRDMRDISRQRIELARKTSRNSKVTGVWEFNGPIEIGGRILDIAIDPVLADTIYVASASGGVWKSTDAGSTYTSIWPDDSAQSIGSVAITSDGSKLYAGTGETGPGGGSFTYGNKGLFVTSDGGATWTSLGLEATERISRVAIDPNNESRIFVAASGSLYTPSSERGVYRSIDGGATWELVLPGENLTSGASDIWIDPTNPNRLYASMWQHVREPARRLYGGVGSGIYRSDDGGDTWSRLGPANGLPAASDDTGRIGIALAPSNPQRLYAIYNDTVGFFDGFYTSIDGGDSWTLQPPNPLLSSSQSSFGWWFARIFVDPLVETRVFVAGVSLMESVSAGLGWTQATGVHADQHAMAWDANVSGRVYLGNDGGMYRSDTNGVAGSWIFGTSQPWTQFYTLDVGEQDPTRVVGGAQDNGCNRSYAATGNGWNSYGCGDGLETLINPVDQQIVFGCSQYGSCRRSTDGGETTSSIGSTTSQRRNWLTPLVFDPNDPTIMYYAGNIVNRSVSGGAGGWAAISPELTDGDPFPGSDEPYPFGTITTVAPAASNGYTLYVGTDDAKLWYTHDLGANWTQSSDPDLPDRWVSRIVVDPTDADVAYATYSGFRNGDNTPYV